MEELGATGKFPDGQVCEDDAGELKLGVGIDGTNLLVVLNFETPVTWIGMGADEALGLAKLIEVQANILKNAEQKGN